MLVMILNPHRKGLGLVIQCVSKEQALSIIGEYDQQILFLLLVCAYTFMNPTKVNEKSLSFTN
jgi:hypothetical protein